MSADVRPEGHWADVRPNDHDRPGLSRDIPCPSCDHAMHTLRCGAALTEGVACPCRCPVPGVL